MQIGLTGLLGCVVGLVVALAGCSGSGRIESERASPIGEWLLVEIEGQAIDAVKPDSAQLPTIHFAADGSVSGAAGVNRFAGRGEATTWQDGPVAFGALAVTRMAGPPEAMDFESRFLDLLSRVERMGVAPDRLWLSDVGGDLLVFARAPAVE